MELFEIVFNKGSIFETLFFNIKAVVEFKNILALKEAEPELYKQWELIAKAKYGYKSTGIDDVDMLMLNDSYISKAIYFPEYTKIAAITYATIDSTGDKPKRSLKRIANVDEFIVIKTFQEILLQISKDGVQSTPHYFPTLCGHSIITNDIPLFVKRLLKHRDKFEDSNNLLPLIIKNQLKAKPWDANVVDTMTLWKFNGVSNTPITTICDFLGLKRNVDLLQMDELSEYYWKNIENDPEDTLKEIALQSANHTNLVIQLFSELRYL